MDHRLFKDLLSHFRGFILFVSLFLFLFFCFLFIHLEQWKPVLLGYPEV